MIALSALLIVRAIGVSATGFNVLNEARGTHETWKRFESITARKADLLSDLREALGYGGVIHKFKNFVLRKDRLLIVDIHAKMLEVTIALTAFSTLELTADESKAILVLEETLTDYLDAVALAENLANSGKASQDIDRIVKINDDAALAALATLSTELQTARKASSESVYASVSRVTSAVFLMIVIVGGLTILLVISFFWFSRVQFVNPLLKLGNVMTGLADDKTDVSIPYVSNRNEVGIMARTIEIFRDNAIRRKIAEQALMEAHHELEERVVERTGAAVRAMKDAERASNAKTAFLSSMSHEMRTPMNVILGYTQLLSIDTEHPLTAKQLDATAMVLKSGNHLLSLIDDVLDLDMIESGKISFDLETQDPTPIMENCAAMARRLAEQQGLTFYDQTADWNLPEIFIDETRFRQVLLNLLSNAVKYNRDGGTVTLAVKETAQNFLRITVTDSGIGIAAEKHSQVFARFSRLGMENSDITGTGIGLTITKELVKGMGGTIGFESTLNLGTTFWLEFQILGGKLSIKDDGEAPGPETAAADATAQSKFTVLCVEDNPDSLKLLETIIVRIADTSMISAHTGELGVDMAEIHRPDAILMDINLPGISGLEALSRLKASAATRDIPVIAMTALASPRDKAAGLKAGFSVYLTKPINVEEVTSSLIEAFGAASSVRSPMPAARRGNSGALEAKHQG